MGANRREEWPRAQRMTVVVDGQDGLSPRAGVVVLLAVLVVGSALRLYDLGARPFHHDEGIHAMFSYKIFAYENYWKREYRYDPTYHGPFLFFANALVYRLLGDTDFTSRLLPALFGIGMLALAYVFRHHLGRGPALAIAGLLSISPIMVYFSRFLHDPYVSVFSLIVVLGALEYGRTRKAVYAFIASAALSLSFAAKENTYIHAFIFASFVWMWFLVGMIGAAGWWPQIQAAIRSRWWMVAAALAVLIASLVGTRALLHTDVRTFLETRHLIRNELVMLVLCVAGVAAVAVASVRKGLYPLVLVFPATFAAAVALWYVRGAPVEPLTQAAGEQVFGKIYAFAVEVWPFLIFLLALNLWFVVYCLCVPDGKRAALEWFAVAGKFLREEWLVLVGALALFIFIWLAFFTVFFQRPEDWNSVRKSFDHWWEQHKLERVKGEKWYYFPRLALYEFLTATAVLLAWRRLWRRRNTLLAFIVYWTVAAIAIYSYAGEKVPWLTVHIVTPLSLLAGVAVWELRPRRGSVYTTAATIILTLMAGFTLFNTVRVCFYHPVPFWERYLKHRRSGKVEPFLSQNYRDKPEHAEYFEWTVYVQTSADQKTVMRLIEKAAEDSGRGFNLPIICYGQANWPTSWYLRKYKPYWSRDARNVEAAIVMGDWEDNAEWQRSLGDKFTMYRIRHRAWWVPASVPVLFSRSPGGQTTRWRRLGEIVRFFFTRRIYSPPIGSTDIALFVQKDLRPGGPIERVSFRPPEVRTWMVEPMQMRSELAWGAQGRGRGQFQSPMCVAVAPDGSIYVSDTGNDRVQKFTPSGQFLLEFGRPVPEKKMDLPDLTKPAPAGGLFNGPTGITVDSGGNVYVADRWNHRVQKFDSEGRFLLQWRGAEWKGAGVRPEVAEPWQGGFFGPQDVAVGKDGSIFVSDTGRKRIMKFTPEGRFVLGWGGEGDGPGRFMEPVGLAVSDEGEVYVADTANHRVQIFTPEGQFVRQFKVFGWQDFHTQPFIEVMPDGSVVVTDSAANRVAQYDSNGTLRRSWGGPGKERGNVMAPHGVAVAQDGSVLVVDTNNHRVQLFRLLPEKMPSPP